MIASQAYNEMHQYSEALDLLTNQFTLSSSPEVIELKKTLNIKLEEQNHLIESKKIMDNPSFIFIKFKILILHLYKTNYQGKI